MDVLLAGPAQRRRFLAEPQADRAEGADDARSARTRSRWVVQPTIGDSSPLRCDSIRQKLVVEQGACCRLRSDRSTPIGRTRQGPERGRDRALSPSLVARHIDATHVRLHGSADSDPAALVVDGCRGRVDEGLEPAFLMGPQPLARSVGNRCSGLARPDRSPHQATRATETRRSPLRTCATRSLATPRGR